MRPKFRLRLGKKSEKTKARKRNKCQRRIDQNLNMCPQSDDEVMNIIQNKSNPYTPRAVSVKSFKSPLKTRLTPKSPLKTTTPRKSSLKRLLFISKSPAQLDKPNTPSKSPFSKKSRRSLYTDKIECTIPNSEFIVGTQTDGNECTSLHDEVTIETEPDIKSSMMIEDSSDKVLPKMSRRTLYTDNTECTITQNEFVVRTQIDDNECVKLCDEFAVEPDITPSLMKEDSSDKVSEDIVKLLPSVMEAMRIGGFEQDFLKFFQLVSQDKFPMTNIALQLWLEVVKWYGCGNTTEMRYSDTTKKFWKLGYRLFGGQFVYFMSGSKNRNSVVTNETERGVYCPLVSDINFAVPGKDILTAYSPYDMKNDVGRKPGLFEDMIDTLAESSSPDVSFCLTFDGKKIKRGLTKTSGDVDLLGFETKGNSLSEKKLKLEEKKSSVKNMIEKSKKLNETDCVTELDDAEKMEIANCLLSEFKKVSLDICEARQMKKNREYAKQKLIDNCGADDWRTSTYVQAITGHIACIFDIEEFITDSIELVDDILICISSVNKSQNFIIENEIDLNESQHYNSLPEESTDESTRKIKQRSQAWFDRRKKVKVTGSSIYSAIGLESLSAQKDHFDVKVVGLPEKERTDKVKAALQHGVVNEINATATMVGKVLPILCPGQSVYEEGFVEMETEISKPFIIISPDGSVRSSSSERSSCFAIEYKCPIYDVQTSFPKRYMLQCLSEMEALDVPELIYLSWFEDITTCFKLQRNTSLFKKGLKAAIDLYDTDKPKRPTTVSKEIHNFSAEIQQTCKDEHLVEFIGIFPSVKNRAGVANVYHDGIIGTPRYMQLLNQMINNYDRFYKLQRVPATEAVVFLCCDLNRKWEADKIHSAPVCWFPKGSSLNTNTMRSIYESVADKCKEKGLHVPAASFDGQWHLIAVRDKNDAPLTSLQLQKDVWKSVEKMSKRDILSKIVNLNKTVITLESDAYGKNTIICTNVGFHLPVLSSSVSKQRRRLSLQQNQKKEKLKDKMKETSNEVETEKAESIEFEQLSEEMEDKESARKPEHEVPVHDEGMDELPDLQEYRTSADHTEEAKKWTNDDSISLLTLLKVDRIANAKKNWDKKSMEDVSSHFTNSSTLRRFRDVELKVIVRYINRTFKKKIRESDRKELKIEHICNVLGLPYKTQTIQHSKTHKLKQPSLLSEIALKQINTSLLKTDLNIIYAEYIWPEEYKTWKQKHSGEGEQLPLDDEEEQFYFPSYSESRQQLEVSCVDSTHLLTRARRKSARGGLEGFSNKAWRKVAKSKRTSLSIGMIDGISESMSVAAANTHFSIAVEKMMIENGDIQEANFCNDIRQWWRAEDEAGIPAQQRIKMRSALRSRLAGHADVSKFPPPGMYIQGWPTQLWEAIIASIDAKRLLYFLAKSKTYHQRAFSSMMGETFFSEVTMFDRRGQGTMTCDEIAKFLDTSIEKLHMRLDPKRTFSYRTARKKVYQLVGQYDIDTPSDTSLNDTETENRRDSFEFKDHDFDDVGRRRLKSKEKEAKQDRDRNAIARGTLPVRFEGARRNESKLLPIYRLGLDLDEVS